MCVCVEDSKRVCVACVHRLCVTACEVCVHKCVFFVPVCVSSYVREELSEWEVGSGPH